MELEDNKDKELNENLKEENPNDINMEQNNEAQEIIIDLPKLATQPEIKNSDIILAILEICTYNKKYNYDCSNNTKAFWDRVVEEEILKKIFRNFKGETLRKYWKIIRLAGNNSKFISTVKQNEDFINSPVMKLLPTVNAIASFIQTEEKDFEKYFSNFNSKDKKDSKKVDNNENSINKNTIYIGNKRNRDVKDISISPTITKKDKKENESTKITDSQTEEKKEEVESKNNQLDELINKLMEKTKLGREEVVRALYGTSNNFEHAYQYLQDNEKYEKYFFVQTDDYIIQNLRNKGYYLDLINEKGEELVKEREKFLGIK